MSKWEKGQHQQYKNLHCTTSTHLFRTCIMDSDVPPSSSTNVVYYHWHKKARFTTTNNTLSIDSLPPPGITGSPQEWRHGYMDRACLWHWTVVIHCQIGHHRQTWHTTTWTNLSSSTMDSTAACCRVIFPGYAHKWPQISPLPSLIRLWFIRTTTEKKHSVQHSHK